MKIDYFTSIANIYANNRYNVQKSVSYNLPVLKTGVTQDTFVKYPSFTSAEPYTVDWYKKLDSEKKEAIGKRADDYIYNNVFYLHYDVPFNRALKYTDIATDCVKDSLNKKYGEGNYVVIPVGRSLSALCKCLGYKIGEDKVKPLPMSSAGRFLHEVKCDEDINLLKKYLKSVDLTKRKVRKSDKHFIFMDYCHTGNSLKGVKTLFESDDMWGHLDNVHFEDVMKLLPKAEDVKEIGGIPSEDFLNNFELDLCRSRYKKYSVVKDCPRFHYMKNAVLDPEHYPYESQIFYWKFLEKELNN